MARPMSMQKLQPLSEATWLWSNSWRSGASGRPLSSPQYTASWVGMARGSGVKFRGRGVRLFPTGPRIIQPASRISGPDLSMGVRRMQTSRVDGSVGAGVRATEPVVPVVDEWQGREEQAEHDSE